PCPKCQARVVVPGADAGRPKSRFETREVEASIAALEAPPGGFFADPTFSLPDSTTDPEESPEPAINVTPGVTFPWSAVYALGLFGPVIVVVSFLLGAFFGGPWIGLSHQP
ncbi:MAG: hypothetical protein WCJ18_09715, partial [Planctomycetota bacterium]